MMHVAAQLTTQYIDPAHDCNRSATAGLAANG